MIMIYFLTLPWFVFLGHIFIINSINSDDDVEPLMMTLAIMLWPLTFAILAGVQLSNFFNKKV